ncbi:hypothetical protein [uncultured Aquimarina sp.]|uniref:hypothetical protein n=1 Tax=uncultured Aquimarina sp. TaxID=575652 RepID=UPI00260DEEF5|nr:hypothetical protein [uncultured Aquimarina sp.]
MKKELQSKLNTIFSCMDLYANSTELKLDEKAISELKKRIETIAFMFSKSEKYTLIKTSGGIAHIYGVGIDTISNKKVAIVYLGGDCSMNDIDLKWEEITTVFNKKNEILTQ